MLDPPFMKNDDVTAPIDRKTRKKRSTRARLLKAAHRIMSTVGVDDAKIRDITDAADIGFGTFYNYFGSKDALAEAVLDCLIHDIGLRNAEATRGLAASDPASVMPTSIRLFVREAVQNSIWRWWALRHDLLLDRVRIGFEEFAKADLRQGVDQGFLRLSPPELDQAWDLACWVMVGCIHDIIVGDRPLGSEVWLSGAIARAWGYDLETARRVSNLPLPTYPPPMVDWTFDFRNIG